MSSYEVLVNAGGDPVALVTIDDRPADSDLADLREEYAENEYDHDRHPTEDGFVEWLAGQVTRLRTDRARAEEHLDEVAGWTLDPTGARIVAEWRTSLRGAR